MNMKSLIVALALAATVPFLASAAEGGKAGKRGPGGGDMLQPMLEKLNLTEEQKAKIKPIREKAAEEGRAFFKEHAAEMKAAREAGDQEKMKTLMTPMMEKRKATMEEIRSILTDEQKQKLGEIMAAHGGHGKAGKRGKKQE